MSVTLRVRFLRQSACQTLPVCFDVISTLFQTPNVPRSLARSVHEDLASSARHLPQESTVLGNRLNFDQVQSERRTVAAMLDQPSKSGYDLTESMREQRGGSVPPRIDPPPRVIRRSRERGQTVDDLLGGNTSGNEPSSSCLSDTSYSSIELPPYQQNQKQSRKTNNSQNSPTKSSARDWAKGPELAVFVAKPLLTNGQLSSAEGAALKAREGDGHGGKGKKSGRSKEPEPDERRDSGGASGAGGILGGGDTFSRHSQLQRALITEEIQDDKMEEISKKTRRSSSIATVVERSTPAKKFAPVQIPPPHRTGGLSKIVGSDLTKHSAHGGILSPTGNGDSKRSSATSNSASDTPLGVENNIGGPGDLSAFSKLRGNGAFEFLASHSSLQVLGTIAPNCTPDSSLAILSHPAVQRKLNADFNANFKDSRLNHDRIANDNLEPNAPR